MKDLIIFILLCVITYQVASDKPWWEPLKHNTFEAVQGLVTGDTTKIKELFSSKTLEPLTETASSTDAVEKEGAAVAPVGSTPIQKASASAAASAAPAAPVFKNGPIVDPIALSPTGSAPGTFTASPGGSITLQTSAANPKAYISFNVSPTEAFNYIYFDLDFTSSGAQGLFNAYMDVQDLGYMDERFYGDISKHQTMGFALTQPGPHIITFRLDQSGSVPSSVLIKNIGTGIFTE